LRQASDSGLIGISVIAPLKGSSFRGPPELSDGESARFHSGRPSSIEAAVRVEENSRLSVNWGQMLEQLLPQEAVLEEPHQST
jgi:hypothetical protein